MKELKVTITHIKVIDVISALNSMKFFPNQEGVYKILHGDIDEETVSFKDIDAFGSLISYSSKKVCRYILALTRYGFVTHIFDRETKELYLTLTEKGKLTLFDYKKKHKNGYKKTQKEFKKTIVKIGE